MEHLNNYVTLDEFLRSVNESNKIEILNIILASLKNIFDVMNEAGILHIDLNQHYPLMF